jgi:DNA-directed RNA polymerase specialized sigma24 family protein
MPKTSNPTPALLNSVDLRGRPIEPNVLSAANEIAATALPYAEKFVGDPCVAMNLLEEVAATVSETVRAKEAAEAPPVRDMRAYVYRAFLRRIADERRDEKWQQEEIEDHFGVDETANLEVKTERKLALKQILSMCDRKTCAIIWGRIEGRSWDDIAYDCVMSNHAARVHYSKAMREIREALRTDPQAYAEKIRSKELKARRKASLRSWFETVYGFLQLQALAKFRRKKMTAIVWRIRIVHREKEGILAEVDRMFE